MKRTLLFVLTLALLTALASQSPLFAQSALATSATRTSAEPLGEIADALSRIADMLERQAEGSRLDLLMKRVDASSRRLQRLEGRLSTAKSEYEQARENQIRMESQLESRQEQSEAEGVDAEYIRFQRRHLETEIELGQQRMATLEGSIARLENEIARRGGEIEDWQAYVDRELSGLR